MHRMLNCGYEFSVCEKNGIFKIKDVIGIGASCIVYLADFTDECGNTTEHILKEYNPIYVDSYRDNKGALIVDDSEQKTQFYAGLDRFVSGYRKQLDIRRISDLKNSTSNIQGIYQANGTMYIDMTYFNGMTYSKIKESTLYDLLRRMKALTCVIGNYHKEGYLHLDIKPDNIYVIPETSEFVMLFDFDSVIEKDKIISNTFLSYTKSWAAPEQVSNEYSKICEATDLFAVGEILFFQLFGRHSGTDDHRSFAVYSFDYDSELLKNVNPQVISLISNLLHKTICVSVKKRYQSADELISALDEIIKIADPKVPYIKSSLSSSKHFFVGRENELQNMHNLLSNDRQLFISGIGGIGKSELAKQYGNRYKDEYDAVVFASYINNLNMLIADDVSVPIYNFFPYPEEQPADYTRRKWRKLKELCNEKILLIIDNFDNDADPDLNKLLDFGCKVIITTRHDFSDYGYNQLFIGSISNRDEIDRIFNEYYKKPLNDADRNIVNQIIDFVDGHTMAVELIAKQMMAGRITPEKMMIKLNEGGLDKMGKERVRSKKDGDFSVRSAYDHIKTLFDISGLNDEELNILANLAIVPHTGISSAFFVDLCELNDYDKINELVANGWVRHDNENDYISLHPVVSDLVFDVLNEKGLDISKFLTNAVKKIKEKNADNTGFASMKDFADFLYRVSDILLGVEQKEASIASFLNEAPQLFKRFGYMKHTLLCYKKALDLRLELFGEENNDTAGSYNNLGVLYLNFGNFVDAEKFIRKSLEIRRKIHGEGDGDIAYSYNNLGVLCRELGRFEEAEEYYLKALEIRKKIYGEDYGATATSYNNLGALYKELGRFEETEEYFLKALEIRKKIYGEEYSATATSYNNLGCLYRDSKDYNKAEEFFMKALPLYIKFYGENGNQVAYICSAVGNMYKEQGLYSDSELYLSKALKIRKTVYGNEHFLTGRSMLRLGLLYSLMDRDNEAKELLSQAYRILKNTLGEEHKETKEALAYLTEL